MLFQVIWERGKFDTCIKINHELDNFSAKVNNFDTLSAEIDMNLVSMMLELHIQSNFDFRLTL